VILPELSKVNMALTTLARVKYEIAVPSADERRSARSVAGYVRMRSSQYARRPSFPAYDLHSATAAADYRLGGVHFEEAFDIAIAVGIKPINRNGHRIGGDILTLDR
jgi:hypothetical protein